METVQLLRKRFIEANRQKNSEKLLNIPFGIQPLRSIKKHNNQIWTNKKSKAILQAKPEL
jgi:hypothetical protein